MKIYWQNFNNETTGWVESELAATRLELQGCDIDVPKQTFDLRVLEGWGIQSPTTINMLEDEVREDIFRKLNIVEESIRIIKACYQNPVVDYNDEFLSTLQHKVNNIDVYLTNIVRTTRRKLKEVK